MTEDDKAEDADPREPEGRSRHGLKVLVTLAVLALVVAGLIEGFRRRPVQARRVVLTAQAVMSTDAHITVSSSDPASARSAGHEGFRTMRRMAALLNRHDDDSEVSRLNRLAGREAVPVSPDTARILERALHFGEITNGAFDVTVLPLIELWKQCTGEDRLPGEAELNGARRHIGYEHVQIDGQGRVRFEEPALRVDLGGIAKGYVVDMAYAAIRRKGFPDALVEAGGDLFAGGVRGDGRPWVVGIQDPRVGKGGPRQAILKLPLSDRGVATSGNYRRFSTIQGKRINHILDPRTGMPAETTASVTVVALDCTTADALATALSVLGIQEGLKLVDGLPDVEALIITVEDGALKFHPSKGWAALGAVTRPDL
jgi:thiamine biosynthesis lipoprotein